MGGPMSVNDDLPWIKPVLAHIQQAFAADIPVMGHCLGGQLMTKALGANVSTNPVQEIGWGEVRLQDNQQARQWFGSDIQRLPALPQRLLGDMDGRFVVHVHGFDKRVKTREKRPSLEAIAQ